MHNSSPVRHRAGARLAGATLCQPQSARYQKRSGRGPRCTSRAQAPCAGARARLRWTAHHAPIYWCIMQDGDDVSTAPPLRSLSVPWQERNRQAARLPGLKASARSVGQYTIKQCCLVYMCRASSAHAQALLAPRPGSKHHTECLLSTSYATLDLRAKAVSPVQAGSATHARTKRGQGARSKRASQPRFPCASAPHPSCATSSGLR